MTPSEQTNSRLSDLDREILRALEFSGSLTGREIAERVGVPGNSIGSRLRSLVNAGLIYSSNYVAGMSWWALTQRGYAECRS